MNLESIKNLPDLENLPVGQISKIECKMLYQMACEMWTGQGEIVEIGSLYGKSTVCLARGMRDNKQKKKTGRLHAFDKWQVDDENSFMMVQLPAGYRGSFRHLFDKNTHEFSGWIVPREGDTTDLCWDGKPIEILFIDCSVSKDFHEMLFKKFYPFLRKGSIVIHQDYFFHRSYYLPLMMLKLGQFVQMMGNVDTSMLFQATKRIPPEMFEEPLVTSDAEIVESLELLIANSNGTKSVHGAILATMLVYFYGQLGETEKVREWEKRIRAGGKVTGERDAVTDNLTMALA